MHSQCLYRIFVSWNWKKKVFFEDFQILWKMSNKILLYCIDGIHCIHIGYGFMCQLAKFKLFGDWPPRIPRRITIVTASEAALAKLWLRSVSITSAAPLLLSPWWRTSKRSGRLCKCGFFLHPHLTSTKKLLGKNYHGFDVEVEDSVVIKLFTLQKNYFKKTCEKVSHKGRHKLLRISNE